MLRNFLKNRKAQNTAEYALLIALVVGGVIAMQTYAQRSIQARIHAAAKYMANDGGVTPSSGSISGETQYEPYYSQSNHDVNTNSTEDKRLGKDLVAEDSSKQTNRTGSENTTYNPSADTNQ